jgi:transcriptional regulator with XRE-family HTH domain
MPPRSKDLEALGEALKEARRERGISQEQLALEAERDRAMTSAAERGVRNLTVVNLLRLCRALDEPPSKLFQRWERIVGWKANKP